MKTSDMIKELCNKKNISLSELARQIGQTPQNFGKKLKRDTVTLDEYERINGAIELEEKDIRHRIRLHICIHWRKIKFIFNEINKSEFIGGESA